MSKKCLLKDQKTNLELFNLFSRENILTKQEIFWLLEEVNNFCDEKELLMNLDSYCKNEKYALNLFSRVKNGEPIPYVIGWVKFNNLKLKVNKNVLIPRQETEELVLKIKDFLIQRNVKNAKVLDVCCGSGTIGLSIKKDFPDFDVYMSDISKRALNVAEENKRFNNIEVKTILSNKFAKIYPLNIKFDILISNPPYVGNIEEIEESVKKYEPFKAVYSKDDIAFYRYYFKNYKKIMNDNFMMFFEIGYDQKERLEELILKYFKTEVKYSFYKDFFDRYRFLFIIKDNESI